MVENPTSEVSVPQEDNRYFSFNLFWLKTSSKSRYILVKSSIKLQNLLVKTGVKSWSIYLYPQGRVPVNRYWTEGTTALNCKRKVRRIFTHISTVKQQSQKSIALAAHLNRIYRKFFRAYVRNKEGHPSKEKQ